MSLEAPTRQELDRVQDATTEALRVLCVELRKRGLQDPRWRAPAAGALLAAAIVDAAAGNRAAVEQMLVMHLETLADAFSGIMSVEQMRPIAVAPQGRPH